MLSERRDEDAATAFFKQAINNKVLFDNIIQIFNLAYIDHSGKPSQN
jgi:hypothetical protein